MANPLTVAEYKARMKQSIGNAEPSTGFAFVEVLNESLRFVFDYHDWLWRTRAPYLVSLTASQSYVTLPSDFGTAGELLSVHGVSPSLRVSKGSLADVADARGMVTQDYFSYLVAVSYPAQTTVASRPGAARLEIVPTPTATLANAFRIVYRAGPTDLTNTTDVPNIPAEYEAALTRIACGNMMLYELGAASPDANAMFNSGVALLNNLMESDGLHDPDEGMIRHGAVRQFARGHGGEDARPFSTFPTLHP